MKGRRITGAWLALPAIAYIAILCVAPLAIVVDYSFRQRDYHGGVATGHSLDAWRMALDPMTRRVVARSAVLAVTVTCAALAFGYPVALSLATLAPRWRRGLLILIAFPLVTSSLLRIYGWINLLPLEWRGGLASVGLVMTANYLPFMILPLLRAIERSEPNVVLAALDLGATPWQAFWRVTWPITRPGMWAGAALVFIPSCGEYLIPHFLGEGQVKVVGKEVMSALAGRNWPFAAACALWLAAVVVFPMIASLAVRRKE